jgi:quinol-cytochrome oxidoreductase complex cytochrome b subunit
MGITSAVDPDQLLITAAQRYALQAGLVSIFLLVAAAAIYFGLRNNLRAVCLTAALLCIQPVWTVTEIHSDLGTTLRVASTIWMFVGCFAFLAALTEVYRHGVEMPRRWIPRVTSRGLLMLIAYAAIVLALTRPPISEEIPVSKSLPALGLLTMLGIAAYPSRQSCRREIRRRIDIPEEWTADRDK